MTLLRLDHVNIRTANLAAMVDWYETVLGMTSGARPPFSFPGAWLYVGDAPVVHLVGVDQAARGDDPKLEHFALAAEGLKTFLARLDTTGTPYRLGKIPGADIVQVNVFDPDGNHIHVDFSGET